MHSNPRMRPPWQPGMQRSSIISPNAPCNVRPCMTCRCPPRSLQRRCRHCEMILTSSSSISCDRFPNVRLRLRVGAAHSIAGSSSSTVNSGCRSMTCCSTTTTPTSRCCRRRSLPPSGHGRSRLHRSCHSRSASGRTSYADALMLCTTMRADMSWSTGRRMRAPLPIRCNLRSTDER